MPDFGFFTRFGLFAVNGFFDADLCSRLRHEMLSSTLSDATLVDGYTSVEKVKKAVRNTMNAKVSQSTAEFVRESLRALKPKLEEHFDLSLCDCEKPQFLVYKEGDYFLPHRDGEVHPDKPEYIKKRQISIIIFLNQESRDPAPDTYCGGALTFYGLIDDPRWKKYGFQLNGQTGLMVAFRSDLLHEVTTVTYGTRFAIVSWFF